MSPPKYSNRDAFTLIELLAVIFIVGILTALISTMFPTLRKSAEKTQCIANLRQVGNALQAYANEHNQKLPGPLYQGQGPNYQIGGSNLATIIAPYLDLPEATDQQQRVAALTCPAWKRKPGTDPQPYRLATPTVNGKVTYPFGYPSANGKAASAVTPLSHFTSRGSVNAIKDYGTAHGDLYNQLYLDWHVETIPIVTSTP